MLTVRTTKRPDRLEAAGHITREPDPSDRRGVLITLTPQGRSLAGNAAVKHLANERRILAGLTAAEQCQLAVLLRKLNLTLPPLDKDQPPPGGRGTPGPRGP